MTSSTGSTPAAQTVAPRRRRIVYLLLAILVGGHLFDVATSSEHWPFSPYAMYANLQRTKTHRQMRLIGITDTDPPREITFNATYLRNTLNALRKAGPSKRPKLEKSIREFMLTYNQGLVYKSKEYPRLKAIRAYEYTWRLKLNPPPRPLDRPDSRRLILQVKLDESSTTPPATQPAPVMQPGDPNTPEELDDAAG